VSADLDLTTAATPRGDWEDLGLETQTGADAGARAEPEQKTRRGEKEEGGSGKERRSEASPPWSVSSSADTIVSFRAWREQEKRGGEGKRGKGPVAPASPWP